MVVEVAEGRGRLRRWWSIWVVGGVDHDAVLRQITEDSGWSGRYAFLIVISAAISLLGLLMPSVAVLIGAMLLSPLMMPIIGLGFGIATVDTSEMRRAATALVAGALIAVALSVVCVTLSPIQTITSEIAGRTRPTLFDLLVALLSAVAGAYALIRGRGGTVVGVAIAIALMPPLVVVGFGIATLNWTVFAGSLLLFVTNAITIALTAALVARCYGFGSHLSPQHTGWQLILFFVGLGLLSIPLGAALRQIAFEAVAQRQVRETISARFSDASRLGQLDIDYSARPIRIRAVVLTPRLDPSADRVLAADLRQRLARPIDVHVDQLRVAPENTSVEAAQIARANSTTVRDNERQQRAVADLALIAGVTPQSVAADAAARTLKVTASPLPGLPMAGYRALEDRANQALPQWTVNLVPPDEATLPALRIASGVIDDEALRLSAWASARRGLPLAVSGGTLAQREAVARGIQDRDGQATVGPAAGLLRLAWPVSASAAPQQESAN
ncbi:putative hydrophobic protein (TIGR00271 family) [Novosphingobium fluoreni]|uniref:Putative hydrophobic protein (TIGR00271 family) n=1 Tax=Novosphingobium fluoreni TaxID=1391222 RepID=A0A7W6BWL0_9SPHN|nr:putative hydrophobic protein (TIGR00271 family) [Novosphingobium fluoreni]